MKGYCKSISLVLILFMFVTSIVACRNKDAVPKTTGIQTHTPGSAAAGSKAEKNGVSGYQNVNVPVEDRVKVLLESMTIDEKVGQMAQAERGTASPNDVKKYFLGSVFSGGGSHPGKNKVEDWIKMCTGYQEAAKSTRLGIPIIYGIDSVHGHNTVNGAVIFPHNIGLGAAGDPELMKRIANVTASEMIATGVNWNFAPCIAVGRDERWGRTYESFSENPDLVSKLSVPYIKELQDKFGIIATAKHYAADGGTVWKSSSSGYPIDQGDAKITEEELMEIHIAGYKKAIEAGVKSVMVSFSSWNGVKNHGNKYLIEDVLKGKLAFKGIVVSDYEAIHQLNEKDFYHQVVASVNAGIDMFMEPNHWKKTIEALKKAVDKGDVKVERINDAVSRILRVKFEMGLFENPLGKKELAASALGLDENCEVARKAVRESLVLLKNKNNILPLKKGAKIYITGPAMDDIGVQCGGWTASWQGGTDKGGQKWTRGTTILDGFKKVARDNGGTIITDKKDAKDADVAVAVLGEKPYAEYEGDDGSLGLFDGTALDGNMKALEAVKESGLPVVVILVSGRPRIVTNEIEKWDAFIEAWLPGSEGDAVAEVLYGDYDFTGKLPVTWPVNVMQIPVSIDEMDGKKPLFEYGFGLSIAK